MADALGGAAAGVTTELIFYGLDSLKVISLSETPVVVPNRVP